MKREICNRKIAKRLADYDKRLKEIRSKVGMISATDAFDERFLQEAISRDLATLAKYGYDKFGRRG